ncbi:MAG: ATP-binding protein [Chloroflexi bacterium]|nr:ATP-binding protein [Chloroflexota bacterium]
MESLADILKRLALKSTSVGTDLSGDAEPEQPVEECLRCEGRGWVRAEVYVGHSDFGKAIPCSCQAEVSQEDRLVRLRRYSNLGPLTRLTFEALNSAGRSSEPEAQRRYQEATQAATEYAQEPQGWLVLSGPVGAGKTHLAAAIANRCLAHGHPTMYISVPDLLDHLRSAFAPTSDIPYDQLFDQVRNAPVLILDDLGAQATTPWAQEKLYQLINHRFNLQLPTVIALSGPLTHLDEQLQARLKDPKLVLTIDLGATTSLASLHTDPVLTEMIKRMSFESLDTRGNQADAEGQESLERAMQAAKVFAEKPSGWLVFTGVPGCGKTHLAVAIASEQLRRGTLPLFKPVPELLDRLRSTYSPQNPVSYDQLFEEVRSAPLLILDDLGAHSSTSWAEEKLYQIVVYRHEMRLPTVITVRGIFPDLPDAVASRLKDQTLVHLAHISAPDFRDSDSRARRSGKWPHRARPTAQGRPRGGSGY